MDQKDIQSTVEKILQESSVGTMATIKEDKPHSRYMTFYHEGMKLYTPTSKDTDKIDELEANPYTHILIGYEGEGFGDDYVEYQGKVSLNDSEEMRSRLWTHDMEMYLEGPHDPNFIVLEIEPVAVRLMNKTGQPPQELEL
ncbi:pyridoxamine 5'-phosphate oxidase family protein [Virgibacillus xinjiangensis]|uniref:Pyridoxamine 5'-phosphate oxidase family protein n=1 Tax=Virgibacillus xinjiangensis TaxID=393090 RepID=A0ABV7CXC9_9BACI